MPKFTSPQTCLRTGTLERFKDISIFANQYKKGNSVISNWNDPTLFTTTTGVVSTANTSSLVPNKALPTTPTNPFYSNYNISTNIYGDATGRQWNGIGTASQITNYDPSLFDTVSIVVSTDTANKNFTYLVTDGTNSITFTGVIPLINTLYRFTWKLNNLGTVATTATSLGGASAGTIPTGIITSETFGSVGTGIVRIFEAEKVTNQLQLPSVELRASICCTDEFTIEKSQDTNDRLCSGKVVGKLVTKEERKITIKVQEMDIFGFAIFGGATIQYEKVNYGEYLSTITFGSGSGNVTATIATNQTAIHLDIEGQAMQRVWSVNDLQYNEFAYDQITGIITVNGTYYSAKKSKVLKTAKSGTNLVLSEKSLELGYNVYLEVPEIYENGTRRIRQYYATVTTFTEDIVKDNDTVYTIEFTLLPDINGEYKTIYA